MTGYNKHTGQRSADKLTAGNIANEVNIRVFTCFFSPDFSASD